MKLKRPLPQGAVVGGIVGTGLLVLLIGWFGVVHPQGSKAASLAKQTAVVEAQITSNLAAIAAQKTTAAATVAPKIRVADVYKLAKAMPSAVDMPDILIELDQVAADSGVQLQNISPNAPASDGTIGLSMSVEGDFFTVTDLLYRLRNLVYVRNGALEANGRLFTVDNLSFSPAGSKIDATIALHTYQYVPGVGVAAPATPAAAPAVTSTDTTSTSTDTTTTTPSPDNSAGGPSAAGAP